MTGTTTHAATGLGQVAGKVPPPSLRWTRAFPGTPGHVPEARRWVRDFLPDCQAADSVLLILTELAANAVTHTRSRRPGGTFTIDVGWSANLVRVAVVDGDAQPPPRPLHDADA